MKEHIILDAYPTNKNSLVLINFDQLRLPYNTDFSSLNVVDNKNNKLLFDVLNKKDYNKKFKYKHNAKENCIAIVLDRDNIKYIKILYKKSARPSSNIHPLKKISIANGTYLRVYTRDVSVLFEKKGFSIEKVRIKDKTFGPLQLVASGGNPFFQKATRAGFDIICNSNIVKAVKLNLNLRVTGSKCKKQGILPVEMVYYFWSSDGKNLFCKAEMEIKYDEATILSKNKAEFLDPLIWYRLDNCSKRIFCNALYTNIMDKSHITTLKHPYYAYFSDKNIIFMMCPYLALPNDGIHIEKGKEFFGASWHSLSQPKKPYWLTDKKEHDCKQGYFPAHSLRGYWKIGMYFGSKENIKKIASVFSYQTKIKNALHISHNQVSNACITRWKNNKKIAFNAITDDAKINDYIYRSRKEMPKWVQIAIATRTLFKVNYHRFCFIGNKIFYLPKPLLSTPLSTLLCILGIGKPVREKFKHEDLSYLLHTNTHPKIYRLDANSVSNEVKKSEAVWISKWKYKIPLSYVFSYTSPYGIATERGSKEKVTLAASKYIQWIREWPIPHAPLDFFLPTKLFWGICIGELFDKKNCSKIKKEFIQRYNNGCDYMLIAGHVPDYNSECPKYITGLFDFFEKYKDAWFASADEIIRYYKSRENIAVSRTKKIGKKFLIEFTNSLPSYFATEITIMQNINKKINKMQFTSDKKNYSDVNYRYTGKNTIMYNIPSNTKYVVIS